MHNDLAGFVGGFCDFLFIAHSGIILFRKKVSR